MELYADERLRQMIETSEKKKKKRLTLNCCQNTLMSSGSSSAFVHNSSAPPALTAGSMVPHGADALTLPIARPTLNGINNINNSTNANNKIINSNNHNINGNNRNHGSMSSSPISTFKASSILLITLLVNQPLV
ncbi:unnamed protein product [Anisakis simplex]|uniref:Uncharacterized protein n=1 Tax=Anisakis simplex TaxID=6269 RepID=A0A3P6SMJ1_ANISI|nr:unnamed protein product [Anisakis simplex]